MAARPCELATPALQVEHVGHRYGARVALDDVSLTVRRSSFTVLLGLNGAGKSTLFSLVTRLFAIRSGRIHIWNSSGGQESLNLSGLSQTEAVAFSADSGLLAMAGKAANNSGDMVYPKVPEDPRKARAYYCQVPD